jgi:transposase
LLTIAFGTSRETSDFIVDCLKQWWQGRREHYGHIRELVIKLDNGPELASGRTQFIKRLVEFADKYDLRIRLVYYPPYHSKYNPIERCWGILENHWNGTLLESVETALNWAKTMTWKGVHPAVKLLEGVYETGIRVTKKAFQPLQKRLQRSEKLPSERPAVPG